MIVNHSLPLLDQPDITISGVAIPGMGWDGMGMHHHAVLLPGALRQPPSTQCVPGRAAAS